MKQFFIRGSGGSNFEVDTPEEMSKVVENYFKAQPTRTAMVYKLVSTARMVKKTPTPKIGDTFKTRRGDTAVVTYVTSNRLGVITVDARSGYVYPVKQRFANGSVYNDKLESKDDLLDVPGEGNYPEIVAYKKPKK